MQSFMTYGHATAVLDYTSDFSALLIGLVTVEWFAAAIIVWMAIQHYWSQTQQPTVDMPSLATDQQDAA